MLKILLNIIKKLIFSFLLIYMYNKLTLPLDIFIPINIFTILLVAISGLPSILMLVLFSIIFI